MSRRTIRLIDLLCAAWNQQQAVETAQRDIARYGDNPRYRTTDERDLHRALQKHDAIVTKMRS